MYTEITKCRACGGDDLVSILHLGSQALTGVFPRSRAQPVSSGPLELVKCMASGGCGLVQLRQSYDLAEMYGMNYGYRSGLNESMVQHLRAKVRRILDADILLDGDLVIDIGSNDATTLKAYPQGRFNLVGVDPTGVKFSAHYPPQIRLIADFFSGALLSEGSLPGPAKVITSFSMFYDLESPVAFMRDVEASLHDEGIWVFEQSYLPAMLDANSFDTICHEHLEFYSLKQIDWMATRAGLKILDVEFNDVNGGSFSITAAKAGSGHRPNEALIARVLEQERLRGLDGVEPFAQFVAHIDEARTALIGFLERTRTEGKVVMGLGASTKGNVLLQHFGITEALLPCIGEVNPDKFDCFTPGSLIPICPEDEVLARKPDYLLILPWHFRTFFERRKSLSKRTMIVPLPKFEIIQPSS